MSSLSFLRRRTARYAIELEAQNPDTVFRYREKRGQFINELFQEGGKPFVDRVSRFGIAENGNVVRMPGWFCEYLEGIGDFRIAHTLTTGNAQSGKTLGHTFLLCDCLTTGKLNGAWFYNSMINMNRNVPTQFSPVIKCWVARMREDGARFQRGIVYTATSRIQIDYANAIFSYVSTSAPGRRGQGLAAAGGAAISFQADWMVLEERSQYPPGAADPLPRRLDASLLATRPVRELGTPGGGMGIEAEVATAHHHFYPHINCPSCERLQALDPMGCLLQPGMIRDTLGREISSYLSASGRPQQWFCHDTENPVETAYFGCRYCKAEIDEGTREAAWFVCLRTGITLRKFLDDLPRDVPRERWKVVFHLSPLLRTARNNLAAELIQGGLNSSSPVDWQQQALGHPSKNSQSNIDIKTLAAAIIAGRTPLPDDTIPITVAGIDVGRSSDWIWICRYHLPRNWRKQKPMMLQENAIREVVYGGDVQRRDIPEILGQYQVQYGLIDNEPSRESSMRLCDGTVLEMGDQIPLVDDVVRKSMVKDGGYQQACWQFRASRFADLLLESFIRQDPQSQLPLMRLPAQWEKWLVTPSERSPITHLSAPWRDESGRWQRGRGNIDDLFFAAVFCEAAFYILFNHNQRITGSGIKAY